MMCPTFFIIKFQLKLDLATLEMFAQTKPSPYACRRLPAYLLASSIATATATVIPTMGLFPAPMRHLNHSTRFFTKLPIQIPCDMIQTVFPNHTFKIISLVNKNTSILYRLSANTSISTTYIPLILNFSNTIDI